MQFTELSIYQISIGTFHFKFKIQVSWAPNIRVISEASCKTLVTAAESPALP